MAQLVVVPFALVAGYIGWEALGNKARYGRFNPAILNTIDYENVTPNQARRPGRRSEKDDISAVKLMDGPIKARTQSIKDAEFSIF
jgi:hypothetical protein